MADKAAKYYIELALEGIEKAQQGLAGLEKRLGRLEETRTIKVGLDAKGVKSGLEGIEQEIARKRDKILSDEYMRLRVSGASPDRATVGVQAKSDAMRKKADEGITRLTEATNRNVSTMEKGLAGGGVRRGVAGTVYEMLGGGVGSAFTGAMVGVIASAIAFPIAWAIGDAVMKIPALTSEHVGVVRGRESLGVPVLGKPIGERWLAALAGAEAFAGKLQDVEGKNIRPQMSGWLKAYQNRGYVPGHPDRAGTFLAMTALFSGVGLEDRPQSMMQSLKDLEEGNEDERAAAIRKLAAKPYIKRELMDQMKEEVGGGDDMRTYLLAKKRYEFLLGRPFGWGYSPEHITGAYKNVIADDPRMRQQAFQSKQLRGFLGVLGEQGSYRNLAFQLPGEWSRGQKAYAYIMKRYLHERRAAGKEPAVPSEWIPGRWNPASEDEIRERAVRHANKGWPGKISQRSQRDVDKWLGARHDPKSLIKDDMPPAPGFYPSRFQFTSFSGLAESMQQMWGNFPADTVQAENTTAIGDLTTAVREQTDMLAAAGFSGIGGGPATAVPFSEGDINVPAYAEGLV